MTISQRRCSFDKQCLKTNIWQAAPVYNTIHEHTHVFMADTPIQSRALESINSFFDCTWFTELDNFHFQSTFRRHHPIDVLTDKPTKSRPNILSMLLMVCYQTIYRLNSETHFFSSQFFLLHCIRHCHSD